LLKHDNQKGRKNVNGEGRKQNGTGHLFSEEVGIGGGRDTRKRRKAGL